MKVYEELQQGTEEWFNVRRGKITGSRVKSVMSSNNLPLVYELIAEKRTTTKEESISTPSMQRGTELENVAIQQYESETFEEVKSIGFVECEEIDNLGVSPDGVIYNEAGQIERAVEVKCPMTKTHVKYLIANKLPSEYRFQVYLYFLVIQTLQEVDFISFDPRFTDKPLMIVTIKRDDIAAELEQLKADILKFNKKVEQYESKLN